MAYNDVQKVFIPEMPPGKKAECDEIGFFLTQIFPGTTYDKETTLWDLSQSQETIDFLLERE